MTGDAGGSGAGRAGEATGGLRTRTTPLPAGVPANIAAEVATAALSPVTPPDRPVAFVGLMASGKTSLGKRVAAALDVEFVDADREIERRDGRTVAEIFAAEGEQAFREVEEQVISELVSEPRARVVATGGGAILSAATRELLRRQAIVVWLRASPAVLASRVRPDGSRPLLVGDARATLTRLADERESLYAEVAHHIVDVDGGDRRTLLRQVLEAVCPPGSDTTEEADR